MDVLCRLSVNDCWVVGLERFAAGPAGEEEEFFEIRTEWSEKSITYQRRRYHDLVKLVKNVSKSFPDDRGHLSQSLMLEALQRIKKAEENNNVETRLDEVEKLLRNIIKKFSQSEEVLTFFKTSPLDYTLKTMYAPIQPFCQSPVTVADVRRANGFCLANTETVLFDAYLLAEGAAEPSSKYSSAEIESQIWTGMRIQNGFRCTDEPGKGFMISGTTESKETNYQPKKSQITTSNLTYLHLQACETDILE
ncbi:PX domain-containing protein 1 isoform X2 [Pseudorasbora parva]|uniref:PX domain-containing protein 1 isoform X2 n=1 Tax=Pseudorasbora parva TaxID=51549 RepID=UPI00351EF144